MPGDRENRRFYTSNQLSYKKLATSQASDAILDGPKHVQSLHGLSVVTSSLKDSSVSPPPCTRQSPKSCHSKTQASQEISCSCSCSCSSKSPNPFTLLQQAKPKVRSKGYGMASAGKRLPHVLLLLLLGLAAAALSVVVLHKVREHRAFAVHIQERGRQVVSLRIFLQVRSWSHGSWLLFTCIAHSLGPCLFLGLTTTFSIWGQRGRP